MLCVITIYTRVASRTYIFFDVHAAFQCYIICASAIILKKPIADTEVPELGKTRRPEAMVLWTNLVGKDGPRLYPTMILHCVHNFRLNTLLEILNAKNSQELLKQCEERFNKVVEVKVGYTL
jgi:hypothetical protein